jgi:Fe-S-cluster containining protein
VEAGAVRRHAAGLSDEARTRLRERARAPRENRCVALDDDGRCAIYDARPLVCRSHGAPIRMRDSRSLPVVDACFRNFPTGFDAVEESCILEQETLSTLLHAVNQEHAGRAGAGERVPLARILANV